MLECESGVSFADVIDSFLPRGWFLPTTPGTKFVTVGGAIAADIHGKNHHRVGSFGNFVDEITMVVGDGSVIRCSRSHDPELFFATLGGMGLTGMILAARFRLVPAETAWITVRHRRTANLDDTLTVFHESDASCEHSVAWIDCMARGERLGRSVVMQGNHATLADLDSRQRMAPLELPHKRTKTVPFTPPVSLLSPLTVRAFNGVFYAAHGDEEKLVDLDAFFFRSTPSCTGIGSTAPAASCNTRRFSHESLRPWACGGFLIAWRRRAQLPSSPSSKAVAPPMAACFPTSSRGIR